MRAWAMQGIGGSEALEEVRMPVPQPGDAEVVIRVEACGLNLVDLLMMAGRYQVPTSSPHVPGLEVCGKVAALGEGTTSLSVGDRVAARCERGGAAEFVAVSAARCVPVPASIPAPVAASFLISFGTADHFLRNHGRLRPDNTVLVLGASGAVGSAALQIARLAGATSLGVVSSPSKRAFVLANGAADCLVLTRGSSEAAEAVKRFMSDRPPDIVLDPVGGELSEAALRAIAPGGRYLVVGFAAGIPRVPLNLPLLKRCAIIGDSYRAYCEAAPDAAGERAGTLMREVAAGRLRPAVPHVLPFSGTPRAFDLLQRGAAPGRVAVLVNEA